MLGMVWRKGNPSTLLLGMYVGAVIMENSMEALPKHLKVELPYDPAIPLLGIYAEKNHNLKRYVHPYVHISTIDSNRDMDTI